MHNMEKCGWGTGRPQGCSLRSHRRRRLAPLPPPFLPAPMLRHVVYASLLHFGVETANHKITAETRMVGDATDKRLPEIPLMVNPSAKCVPILSPQASIPQGRRAWRLSRAK